MATATIVGDFVTCCKARALSIKPRNKLPQSPRNIVAGLKLKRRNPTRAPASARVIRGKWELENKVVIPTTTVENKAEPAARPSKPSIKLKALVIAMTHKIVNGKLIIQEN